MHSRHRTNQTRNNKSLHLQKTKMALKDTPPADLPFELQSFYSNECYVCRQTIEKISLRRCGRCRLISYCGEGHQREHFKVHKDFCKSIADMMREKGCSHILKSLYNKDPKTWKAEKEKLFLEAQSRVSRPLLPYERLMFIFPRCCLICHDSRQDSLIDCKECPAMSFCRKHKSDPSHTILKDCYWIDHCQMLDADLKGYTRTTFIDKIQNLISCIPMNEVSKKKRALNLPGTIEEFLEKYMKSKIEIPQITKFHASEFFAQSLTVFNAVQRLNLSHYLTVNQEKSEMVLHATGCDLEFDRPIFWEILLHLLPNLKTLKVLITDLDSVERIEPNICSLCRSREKELIIETLDVSYEEYLDDKALQDSDQSSDWKTKTKPDLVIFYDFTPFEEEDKKWTDISETWGKVESPLVITAQSPEKIIIIWNKLKYYFGASVNVIVRDSNTFSSIRPRRDEEKFGAIYMKCHCWIICKIFRKTIEEKKTKKCTKCGELNLFLDDQMTCKKCTKKRSAEFTVQMLVRMNASNFYYQNSCHICRSRPESLSSCKRCGMISYCGEQHRKEHWTQHRDFCKVIIGMQKEIGSSNLFESHKSADSETWLRTKINLMAKAQSKLGRPLLNYEQEMFKFPKACLVCRETNPKLLERCHCEMSLCKRHKKCPRHALMCEAIMYSYSYELSFTACYSASSPREAFAPLLQVSIDKMLHLTEFVTLPPTIELFIALFFKLDEQIKKIFQSQRNIPRMRNVVVSKYFSRPLTLIYALEKLKRPGDKKLVIHVIGSCNEEVDGAIFWECLLHWLPTLRKIRVILISPELPRQASIVDLCESCQNYGYQYYLGIYGLHYEEYLQSEFYRKPNIVMGFNLDIHESDFGFVKCTWKESILAIAKQNVPFVLTSASKDRARRENEKLGKILGKEVKYLWMDKNPYRCLQPYRDYESERDMYLNAYMTIYTDLSPGKERKESREKVQVDTTLESGEIKSSKKKEKVDVKRNVQTKENILLKDNILVKEQVLPKEDIQSKENTVEKEDVLLKENILQEEKVLEEENIAPREEIRKENVLEEFQEMKGILSEIKESISTVEKDK